MYLIKLTEETLSHVKLYNFTVILLIFGLTHVKQISRLYNCQTLLLIGK